VKTRVVHMRRKYFTGRAFCGFVPGESCCNKSISLSNIVKALNSLRDDLINYIIQEILDTILTFPCQISYCKSI